MSTQNRQLVLITGANGLLGQKLVELLSTEERFEVIATGRGENRNPITGVPYRKLDITVKSEVMDIVTELSPDFVVNTAAMTQVDDCELNPEACQLQNVTAVSYLTEACKTNNTFLIHISTDFIFDGAHGPYHENDKPNPQNVYAKSKLDSEVIIQSMGTNWAIARTMLVFGIVNDMSRSNIILWVKKSLEDGKKIQVVNDQWRMPTLAEDLASGCVLILEKRAEGIFHLSGKDMLSPYDMAIETAQFFQLDKSLIEEVDGSVFSQPAKRPARTGFVLDKAKKVLGYDPKSFEEGLKLLSFQLDNLK